MRRILSSIKHIRSKVHSAYRVVFSKKTTDLDLIKRSSMFDAEWYAATYQVKPSDAARHFLDIGYKNGNDPSMYFSIESYLDFNPEVRDMNINPLVHYERVGKFLRLMFHSSKLATIKE